jgi:hypothetical protein
MHISMLCIKMHWRMCMRMHSRLVGMPNRAAPFVAPFAHTGLPDCAGLPSVSVS